LQKLCGCEGFQAELAMW